MKGLPRHHCCWVRDRYFVIVSEISYHPMFLDKHLKQTGTLYLTGRWPGAGSGASSEVGWVVAAVKERGHCMEALRPKQKGTHRRQTQGQEAGWGLIGKSPVIMRARNGSEWGGTWGQVQRMDGPCRGNAQRGTLLCADRSGGGGEGDYRNPSNHDPRARVGPPKFHAHSHCLCPDTKPLLPSKTQT